MSEFKSKFNPAILGHRFKMLQLMHGLALEINTGMKVSSKGSLVKHAQQIGWLPDTIRLKKVALGRLVDQARRGFGYVPKDSVSKALRKPRKGTIKARQLAEKASA